MSPSDNEFFDKANNLTPLRPGPQPVSGVVPNSGACIDAVARMSNLEKLRRTFEYALSLPTLSNEAKLALRALVDPESLKVTAMILAGWALAHFFGVGEVVDAILVGFTLASLGPQGMQGLADLVEFGYDVINAKCDFDLRRASEKLARAFIILGVELVQALLRGKAQIKPNHAKAVPRNEGKAPQSSAPPRTQEAPSAESPKASKQVSEPVKEPPRPEKPPETPPANTGKFKWGNPKSGPTYGHTFDDHGKKLKPSQLSDRARAKGHQIGQWTDDKAAADFIAEVAKKGPGVHEAPLPAGMGRSFMGDGKELATDMARVVVKPDGAVRTAFPYSSAHPN
jgi:hypothetical protein